MGFNADMDSTSLRTETAPNLSIQLCLDGSHDEGCDGPSKLITIGSDEMAKPISNGSADKLG